MSGCGPMIVLSPSRTTGCSSTLNDSNRVGSEPSGSENLSDVLSGVFAHAVESCGAGPKHRPRQVVWVPRDLGVEEVDGGVLPSQELFGVVEVLPSLRDRPPSIVVEFLVLVTGDDVPGFQGLDLVDRAAPWPEASNEHTS